MNAPPPPLKSSPLRSLARVTLELTSPLHVGTGRGEGEADAGFVRDANGLPLILGTSLMGRLRRLMNFQDPQVDSPFGYQLRDEGMGSRLLISNGVIHSSKGFPCEGIVPPSELESDPVLKSALVPRLRDHVSLSGNGTVINKFDDLSVATGHRFTFELEFIHSPSQDDLTFWNSLLASLTSPHFRLGGKTRRGFGSVRLVEISQACLDLRLAEGFAAYAAHPASLADKAPALKNFAISASPSNPTGLSVCLQPDSFWMFGGGTDADADAAPVRDERITWKTGSDGQASTHWFIPFSGVKGALNHRTLFHARVAAGAWEGSKGTEEMSALAAHAAIFGTLEGKDGLAMAGRLFGDDIWLNKATGDLPPEHLQHHVALDRLTGGALESALFSDKPLWQNEMSATALTIPLFLEEPAAADAAFQAGKAALILALTDLEAGRLALGGLTGRGYGRFSASSPTPAAP